MKKNYQVAKKVTLVSAFFNAVLACFKIVIGQLSGSHALFADGMHSASDLLTDFLVLIASKYGSQGADLDHPYGHHRIETAATLFLSLLLVVTGCAIVYDAGLHFFNGKPIIDGTIALIMVFASLIVNEALFHYTLYYGRKIESKLLIANAWHHRSDSLSSLVVLIGLIGNLYGLYYCDAIAAIIVGLLIVKMGWKIGWSSMQELIDRGIEQEGLAKIEQAIKTTPGVVAVHQLRTRSMAGSVLVDVHVLVDEKLSVSEGHYIGQNVALNIRDAVKAVNDVTVHIDPEDDEVANPSINLPTREELLASIYEALQSHVELDAISKIDLHYLNGSIEVEMYFDKDTKVNKSRCKAAVLAHPDVTALAIYQSL